MFTSVCSHVALLHCRGSSAMMDAVGAVLRGTRHLHVAILQRTATSVMRPSPVMSVRTPPLSSLRQVLNLGSHVGMGCGEDG